MAVTRIEYVCPAVRPVKTGVDEVGRVVEIVGKILYT